MNRLDTIKRHLGITHNDDDAVILNLLQTYTTKALNVCRRTPDEINDDILDVVVSAVCMAYNQRGSEGFASSNIGGQSYVNLDVMDKMCNELIRSGLRVARF